MAISLSERLLLREQSVSPRRSRVSAIYGDSYWVHNLDIVNELGGHRGCVNALSWSKSGQLLASGSDDTNLLIHRYQADGCIKPFTISTEIATGHTENIFSVKFMPHSNDNILISCAGDGEVRVFDIEHSSRNRSTNARGALGFQGGATYQGIRFLGEGDTNARVYRSHADRVKRIVTESSPFLFLTCSEDGEVRQWDLRQPSSAYPEPRGAGLLFASLNRPRDDDSHRTVPPPLISYRRYRLDLNTISCSASQPHYIALGGAHLHCFLHDRRMIGRDTSSEHGSDSSFSINTDFHGDAMGKATRCVRRFAPDGKPKMGRLSNGHITACKISDANPNEMVVSWSGDHIYSFDLLRSPDAQDSTSHSDTMRNSQKSKAGGSLDRKRKRVPADASSEDMQKQRRSRSSTKEPVENVALRVRYGNGQSEEITLESSHTDAIVEGSRSMTLSHSQKRSMRVAKNVIKLRRLLLSLEISRSSEVTEAVKEQNHDNFQQIISLANNTLDDMDKITRRWKYPVSPLPADLTVHTTLRRQRDRARRFVQAAGTIAQVLDCRDHDVGSDAIKAKFSEVTSPSTEGPLDDNREIFRYDFLKAILAWIRGGVVALLAAFRKGSRPTRQPYRFPIPEDAGVAAIDRHLIRHLLLLATEEPIPDLERSRFEHDETRQLFQTERYAVTAFAHIIEIATEAQQGSHEPAESSRSISTVAKELAEKVRSYDEQVAHDFWGLKVARGLLAKATEGINFPYVDTAFGGLGRDQSMNLGRSQTDIDPEEDDPEVTFAEFVTNSETAVEPTTSGGSSNRNRSPISIDYEGDSDEEALLLLSRFQDEFLHEADDEDLHNAIDGGDILGFTPSTSSNDDDDDEGNETNEDVEEDSDMDDDDAGSRIIENEEEDDDDGEITWGRHRLLWSSTSDRARMRAEVDGDVPVNSHTRVYQGHCNVKTVKDVNFYGIDDEYVVSGSDSGHIFIWDKKTTKLLNILEGDGDTVNVIQGHPYEPMLAASGIDNTIKIFSPDSRAQRDARLGINLAATLQQSESNISVVGRQQFHRTPPRRRTLGWRPFTGLGLDDAEQPSNDSNDELAQSAPRADILDSDDDEHDPTLGASALRTRPGLTSRRCMHDSYAITSQNDSERSNGWHDAFMTVGLAGTGHWPPPPPILLRPVQLSFAAWRALFDD